MMSHVVGIASAASLAFCVYTAALGPAPAPHKSDATATAVTAAEDCCELVETVSATGPACSHCEAEAAHEAQVLLLSVAATPSATAPASKAADAKNTQCVVMPEDPVGSKSVEYKGVSYKLCCEGCIESFNKDPEKYVKAFNANPAKYGVKK